MFECKRKSYIEKGEIYFWTATINGWQRLLQHDRYKDVVIGSLEYLSITRKIEVFAFVIMPNHIHLIWRILENNGKESARGSFLKFTAHEFKKMLVAEGQSLSSGDTVLEKRPITRCLSRDEEGLHFKKSNDLNPIYAFSKMLFDDSRENAIFNFYQIWRPGYAGGCTILIKKVFEKWVIVTKYNSWIG